MKKVRVKIVPKVLSDEQKERKIVVRLMESIISRLMRWGIGNKYTTIPKNTQNSHVLGNNYRFHQYAGYHCGRKRTQWSPTNKYYNKQVFVKLRSYVTMNCGIMRWFLTRAMRLSTMRQSNYFGTVEYSSPFIMSP